MSVAEIKEVRTISEYIKAIIAGHEAQPPKSKLETLTALMAARTAIGCVHTRYCEPRRRIQAELVRVRDESFSWGGHE